MDKMSDKRKYKRIEKPYITRFRIKPDEIQNMAPTSWDMVAANNLGAGGVFFNSSKDFEEGTTLDLKIGFSTSMPLIKCDGIVIRVKKHPHTFIFGVATAFTEIDEHEKEMIKKPLKKIT